MLAKRIIPCLDINNGRVVKGVHFLNLRDAGDPVEQARIYDAAGADELVFLDISATPEGRATAVDTVRSVADQVFMPLAVGGGIRTVEDMRRMLLAGADKVSVNSAAVRNPICSVKALTALARSAWYWRWMRGAPPPPASSGGKWWSTAGAPLPGKDAVEWAVRGVEARRRRNSADQHGRGWHPERLSTWS